MQCGQMPPRRRSSSVTSLLQKVHCVEFSASGPPQDEQRITRAEKLEWDSTFDHVVVRYGKCWSHVDSGVVPSAAVGDAYAQEAAIEWRTARSGTGSSPLVLDTYFLRHEDAQDYADTALAILQDGLAYRFHVAPGTVTLDEMTMAPFAAVEFSWPADTFLATVPVGNAVAAKITPNMGMEIVTFFGG